MLEETSLLVFGAGGLRPIVITTVRAALVNANGHPASSVHPSLHPSDSRTPIHTLSRSDAATLVVSIILMVYIYHYTPHSPQSYTFTRIPLRNCKHSHRTL